MKKNPQEQSQSFSSVERQLAIEFLKEHREKLLREKDKYVWEKNARPNQLPPKRFTKWLCIAGRGWGKTRVLTEFCRMKAQAMPGSHGVIVGRTAADVRDVIVEGGESSLLKISPPDFFPKYEPSKRRLTWPNGTTANLYSADEPDSLRGPQCLVGPTLVSMADGSQKRIDSVVAGDYVQTRRGPRKVLRSWLSSSSARLFSLLDSSGRNIIGTDDHLVFVHGKGFVPFRRLCSGDRICVTPALSSTGRFGISGQLIKRPAAETITSGAYYSTGSFGKSTTGRYHPNTRSTTKTRISTITISRILKCCPRGNTPNFTLRGTLGRIVLGQSQECWRRGKGRIGNALPGIFGAPNAETSFTVARSGQASTVRESAPIRSGPEYSRKNPGSALDALLSILQPSEYSCTVPATAIKTPSTSDTQARLPRGLSGTLLANTVRRRSKRSSVTLGSAQENAPSTTMARVVSVNPLSQRQPVYDIEVEGEHEFFANGILVHNCHWGAGDELAAWSSKKEDTAAYDNFMMGARLRYKGQEPQVMFATTPRPNKVVRALLEAAKNPRSGVVAVRGSTYENRANLAEKFFNEIITQYEGTRIGRQELDGELLEDIPGQLWTPEMFDQIRVKRDSLPEMLRIVVAIDPSVSSGENSDECGIVVVGMGVDGLFYLLKDASGVMSPSAWAKEAIAQYHQWHADCIIGEKNNGGDLVETNLRTVDEFVPYRSVYASHGKAIRAQPIAGLYEQGKVRHLLPGTAKDWTPDSQIGTAGTKFVTGFEKLETQYCGFTNQEYEGEGSPDRADAAIWGLSEFLENGRTTSRMFPEFRAAIRRDREGKPTEPENAMHVKATPADVKPWWPRWISINLDRTESAAHWWFKEPSGRVRIYRELVVAGSSPESFGVAVANASLREIQGQRSIPVWLAEEAFTRQGVKSVAASVADGIKRTLGEHKAFMFVHDQTEMDIQDQNKRNRAIESRLARMPGGFLCIRALAGSRETSSGWDIVSDLLKWRKEAPKAKQEAPNWAKAMKLAHSDVLAYTAYIAEFMKPTEQDTVAPLLLIDTSATRLIQAMSGAAAGEKGKLADSITGSVLQSLRIGALASRENAGREPEEEFIARKMDQMPAGASPISLNIQFERARQEYRGAGNDGVSLHRVAAQPRVRVM